MATTQAKKPREALIVIEVSVQSGDTLRVRAQRTTGSASIEVRADGARLTVEK